jgi:hypothetical protein
MAPSARTNKFRARMVTQQRQSSVTTERHKMQVATAIVAFQILRHQRPTQEPTCNPDTRGTQQHESPYPIAPLFAARVLFSLHAQSKKSIHTLAWATRQLVMLESSLILDIQFPRIQRCNVTLRRLLRAPLRIPTMVSGPIPMSIQPDAERTD